MLTRRSPLRRLIALVLVLATLGAPAGALAQPINTQHHARPQARTATQEFGDPYLVADLTTGGSGVGSDPYNLIGVSGTGFFVADTPATGDELWRTDGTLTGTVMVTEIYPGAERGVEDMPFAPRRTLVAYDDRAYFAGHTAHHGTELWASDGTEAGTVLVRDIATGTERSEPQWLIRYDGELYFTADDGVHGTELWKSDGTYTGTVLVKDIDAGIFSSNIEGLETYDGRLWFSARDNNGDELWVSDGTVTGTYEFKNINPGSAASRPQLFTTAGGLLYFTADTASDGRELWVTDGTVTNTFQLQDINPGTDDAYIYERPVAAGGLLFFDAFDPTYGDELWRSDGTVTGTVRVADIYSGTNGSGPAQFSAYSGAVYYWANDGVHGSELWRTTITTTELVTDLMPIGGQAALGQLYAHAGDLYFAASDGVYGRELWRYDGVAATRLTDLNPGPEDSSPGNFFGATANFLYFIALDGIHGSELFRLNLLTDEVTLVKNIAPDAANSDLEDLAGVGGGQLFFEGYEFSLGDEPYASDGTEAGTHFLGDLDAGNSGSDAAPFVGLGDGRAVFSAGSDDFGTEPWVSDGTPGGTLMLRDIYTGTPGSYPEGITPIGGAALFFADEGELGQELWRTDGTPGGTLFVRDIYTGSASGYNGFAAGLPGLMLFGADDGVHGEELWLSDGTFEGTRMLTDLSADPYEDLYPQNLVTAGNRVFFTGYEPSEGDDALYFTDGVSVTLALDPNVTGLNDLDHLLPGATGIFFLDTGSTAVYQVWWTDGYTYTQLTNFSLTDERILLNDAVAVGDQLFFRYCDLVIGCELWSANPAAAAPVSDIYPGLQSSDPTDLAAADGRLVFAASDPVGGRDLWISDGTEGGTLPLADIVPGAGHSNPAYMTVSGHLLFFQAYTEAAGYELWALSLAQLLFLPLINR